jgi:hypothetical protein
MRISALKEAERAQNRGDLKRLFTLAKRAHGSTKGFILLFIAKEVALTTGDEQRVWELVRQAGAQMIDDYESQQRLSRFQIGLALLLKDRALAASLLAERAQAETSA